MVATDPAIPERQRIPILLFVCRTILVLGLLIVGLLTLSLWDAEELEPIVAGPVTLTIADPFRTGEIKLSEQQSAGFIRLVQKRGKKVDGKWLEMSAPYGYFRTGGREFEWHFGGLLVDRRNRSQPTVWHSAAIPALENDFHRELEKKERQIPFSAETFADGLSEFEREPYAGSAMKRSVDRGSGGMSVCSEPTAHGVFPPPSPNDRIGDMIVSYSSHYDHRRALPVVTDLLADELVQAVSVVPIALERGKMVVAVLESCDDGILDRVRFIGNKDIESVAIVTAEAMAYAIPRHLLKT